ncbi:hypothetical protein MRX96_012007 [Rhipicephalus microplus]
MQAFKRIPAGRLPRDGAMRSCRRRQAVRTERATPCTVDVRATENRSHRATERGRGTMSPIVVTGSFSFADSARQAFGALLTDRDATNASVTSRGGSDNREGPVAIAAAALSHTPQQAADPLCRAICQDAAADEASACHRRRRLSKELSRRESWTSPTEKRLLCGRRSQQAGRRRRYSNIVPDDRIGWPPQLAVQRSERHGAGKQGQRHYSNATGGDMTARVALPPSPLLSLSTDAPSTTVSLDGFGGSSNFHEAD